MNKQIYSLKAIPLTDIVFTNILNDRKISEIENSPSFLEMISSIHGVGLLQPVCIQEKDDGYQLLFGKRRFLSFLRLKEMYGDDYLSIPAIIWPSDQDYPVEIAILHENKYRQEIRKDAYIESSLSLLPKFINISSEISLEAGVSFIKYHLELSKGNNASNNILNPEIISFMQSMDKFLEMTKIKTVEFEKYVVLLSFDSSIKDFFYSDAIYFTDAIRLDALSKDNKTTYQSCIKLLKKDSSKQDNRALIDKFFESKEEKNIDEVLKFINNKVRVVKRTSKEISNFNNQDFEEVKELLIKMELIFKKAKGQK